MYRYGSNAQHFIQQYTMTPHSSSGPFLNSMIIMWRPSILGQNLSLTFSVIPIPTSIANLKKLVDQELRESLLYAAIREVFQHEVLIGIDL
jgi:hypothetical protein